MGSLKPGHKAVFNQVIDKLYIGKKVVLHHDVGEMQTFVSLRTHFACFASQVYTSTSVFMHGTECIVADRCSITLVRTADSLHVTYVLVFELIVAGAEMSRL